MAYQFDSPGQLERRIAAQMAADDSYDSTLGVSRKAASLASMSSFGTEDDSFARSISRGYNSRSALAASQLVRDTSQSDRRSTAMRNVTTSSLSAASSSTLTKGAGEVGGTESKHRSSTAVLAPRNVNVPSANRATLAGALAGSLKTSRRSSLSAASVSSHASSSDVRIRSPPLTSTPRSDSNTSRVEKEEGTEDEIRVQDEVMNEDKTVPVLTLSNSAMDPLRESDLPETSSYFRSRVLGERFEASLAGDESLSAAILPRKPVRSKISMTLSENQPSDPVEVVTKGASRVLSSPPHNSYQRTSKTFAGGSAKVTSNEMQSTPKASNSQQERMKAFVLNSVKATNPLRQAQLRNMTPKVKRPIISESTLASSSLRDAPSGALVTSSQADTSVAPSVVSDVSSTNDLTMPATLAMRANTSLPGIGAVEMGGLGDPRVDMNRLQSHLFKMNQQLEKENVELHEERESLQKNYDRALLDNEKLRKQFEQQSALHRRESTTPAGSPIVAHHDQNDAEQLSSLRNEMHLMQDKLNLSKDREEEMRKRLRQLEDALAKEQEARQDDEEHYQIEIKTAADERACLRRQLEEERVSARSEIDRVREAAKREGGDTTPSSDANEVIADLREELQRSDQDLQHFEQLVSELQETVDQLNADAKETEHLREDYDTLEQELRERQAECDDLRDELSEVKDRISDLEIALTERENDKLTLELKLSNSKDSVEVKQLREKVLLLETTLTMTREAAAKEAIVRSVVEESSAQLGRGGDASTPLHKNIVSLRKGVDTPRSPPVAELSNASWMQSQTTLGEAALRRDLSKLRHEHDAVREEVDRKIVELGERGLITKLVEAQDAIQELQGKLDSAQVRDERQQRRLMRLRCGSCKERVELPTDLEKSFSESAMTSGSGKSQLVKSMQTSQEQAEVMRQVRGQLNDLRSNWEKDLQSLQDDRRTFEAEKQEYADMHAKRLSKIDGRARAQHATTLKELSRARRLANEYERERKEDCLMIERMMSRSHSADQESAVLANQLQQILERIRQIDQELQVKTSTFERLAHEIDDRSHIDESIAGNVQILHHDVSRFSAEIERLREERHMLLGDRQTLFSRRKETQQELQNANAELHSAREALQAHQVQLDEQVGTIEALHAAMAEQEKSFEKIRADRDQLREHRREVFLHVGQLEQDLRRVRDESRKFGHDLDGYRRERQRQRSRNDEGDAATTDSVHVLREQFTRKAAQLAKEHAMHEQAATERHKSECRGLLMQIRYEKAKYMRESDLRSDLVHQKHYLVGIVGGLQRCDMETTRFLADLTLSRGPIMTAKKKSFATPQAPPLRRRFKAAVLAIMATQRVEQMARNWTSTKRVKEALRQAHAANKLKTRLSSSDST